MEARHLDFDRHTISNPFGKTKTPKRLAPMAQDVQELLKPRVVRHDSRWFPILRLELAAGFILRNTSGACANPTMQTLREPEWLMHLGYTTPGTQGDTGSGRFGYGRRAIKI